GCESFFLKNPTHDNKIVTGLLARLYDVNINGTILRIKDPVRNHDDIVEIGLIVNRAHSGAVAQEIAHVFGAFECRGGGLLKGSFKHYPAVALVVILSFVMIARVGIPTSIVARLKHVYVAPRGVFDP